jgi:molecular chaperone Hsp33
MDAEQLIRSVLAEFEVEVLEKHPVEYRCYCSRDRVTRALISMGREELVALIEEQGEADLTCQFCDAVYHYTKEDLESILSRM